MGRPVHYNTKQSEAILYYIQSLGENHVTAAQIVDYFDKKNIKVSRTTVYRNLDKLVEDGKIRKYVIDGVLGACFQYTAKNETCIEHFHLRCEDCGELIHLKCGTLNEIKNHVLDKHNFEVNTMKTVLYGKCNICAVI